MSTLERDEDDVDDEEDSGTTGPLDAAAELGAAEARGGPAARA